MKEYYEIYYRAEEELHDQMEKYMIKNKESPMRVSKKTWKVKRILQKHRCNKGSVWYKILWERRKVDGKPFTWEPQWLLQQDIPKLLLRFEA